MGNDTLANASLARALVRVNGTPLYYEIRGSGPPLLFIQGATGDGGTFDEVAEQLSGDYTVLTYHRRGNSLSPRPDHWTGTSIDEQADDAAALLHTLNLAPATVFGTSLGAIIALHMTLRHPDVVRGVIVHEPPLPAVLPNGAEIGAQLKTMVEEGLATVGPHGTMERFIRMNAGDANFERLDPALRKRMVDNAETFFFVELPAVVSYMPEPAALAACEVPALAIAGIDNRDTFYHASSFWVAEQLGAPLQEIPGAHAPYLDHADALASLIRTFGQKLH